MFAIKGKPSVNVDSMILSALRGKIVSWEERHYSFMARRHYVCNITTVLQPLESYHDKEQYFHHKKKKKIHCERVTQSTQQTKLI